MNRESFSAAEAMELLGKEVLSCLERDGIPMGTPGRIIRVRRGGRCETGFSIAVRWQGSGQDREEELTKSEVERYVALTLECA